MFSEIDDGNSCLKCACLVRIAFKSFLLAVQSIFNGRKSTSDPQTNCVALRVGLKQLTPHTDCQFSFQHGALLLAPFPTIYSDIISCRCHFNVWLVAMMLQKAVFTFSQIKTRFHESPSSKIGTKTFSVELTWTSNHWDTTMSDSGV